MAAQAGTLEKEALNAEVIGTKGEPGSEKAPEKKEAPAVATAEDLRTLKSEIASLKTQMAEEGGAAEYWRDRYEKALSGANGNGKAEGTKQDEPPSKADDDLLEIVSSGNAPALDKLLERRGFVKAGDVEKTAAQMADRKITKTIADLELRNRYPELEDKSSEFFKDTAKHYKDLEGRVDETVRLQVAAERAELDGLRAGKRKPPESKEDREARAKAGSGEAGRKGNGTADEDDTALTPFQKKIAGAFGISEEDYMKRARAGIKFTHGGRR